MGDYLAISWPRGIASEAAARLRETIEAGGDWTPAHRSHELAVYVRGPRPPPIRALPANRGAVVGELFDAAATREGKVADFDLSRLAELSTEDIAQGLVDHGWGRYVALLKDRDDPLTVLRDPMGARECLTWKLGAVTLVSSCVEPRAAWAPRGLSIDWSVLGGLLHRSNRWSLDSPLAGVGAVGAGEMWRDDGHRTRLWRPAGFAKRPGLAAPADLARIVDGCVSALARDRQAIVVEISGGFDSAVVAASLARAGAKVARAVNFYWPEPEGDERGWAQAVARRWGLPFKARPRGLLMLDAAKMMRHGGGARPGLGAQDPDLDAALTEEIEAVAGDALFTGQGGDGVFYQMPTPTLAHDILRGAPLPMGRLDALASLARRTRTTVWSLLAQALAPFDRVSPGVGGPEFLAADLPAPPPHPWVADTAGVSRAKRVQIRGLTNIQTAFGDSRRSRAADLLHPLLAQPVVEFSLAVSAPLLAIGDLDRPFARAAFADRLPEASLARRSKGDVTVFFARSLAESLPQIRPFLLDGVLARQGLIDLARLEPLLHAEPMIWRDVVGGVMRAAYMEAWARTWAERLSEGPAAGGASPAARATTNSTITARADAGSPE